MATIVLGVTGSIAAYRAAELASLLVKDEHTVYPLLSAGAAQFIAPATFAALTGQPCPVGLWEEPFPGEIAHIQYGRIADLFVVAPASMNFLARLANGMADDMITASISATSAPVLLAPSMNTLMWSNPATRRNVALLREFGYHFIDPVSGRLACKAEGAGKLADVADIHAAIQERLSAKSNQWQGKHVLVTAGPTREAIDPVRYISNRSSGKMGFAIAAAAVRQGARVTLVSGPVTLETPPGVERVSVVSAQEMCNAAMSAFQAADVVFAAAAVADYRPMEASGTKIKKSESDQSILLTRTPDILAIMGHEKRLGQIVVGFAAETDDLEANAVKKLVDKRADFVVGNDVSQDHAGFDHDTNIVSVFAPDEPRLDLPLLAKSEVAERLLSIVLPKLNAASFTKSELNQA